MDLPKAVDQTSAEEAARAIAAVSRQLEGMQVCQQGVGDNLHLFPKCAVLQNSRLQKPWIFMGVTTIADLMHQRDICLVVTCLLALGEACVHGPVRKHQMQIQPGWLELV